MIPFWLIVLIVGLLAITAGAVLAPTGVNDWFNDHRWVLPAVSFLMVVVISLIVGGYSSQNHEDSVAACERRNPEVVAEVKNLENDRRFLRAIRGLLKDVPLPPEQANPLISKSTLAIEGKSEAIGEKIAGRAQYAVEPGSVVIDCDAAYSGGP